MRSFLIRSRAWWLTLGAGGSLFVLDGCDPTVRGTVLDGVEGATTVLFTTFINALFESLNAAGDEAATTVRAFIEQVPQFLA